MQSQSVRYRVALTTACVAFTFIYVFNAAFFSSYFLMDPDTFLHISVGNLILQNGRFPALDPFSYTAFGKPWPATDWIPELALAILYNIGQWRAVTELIAVTCALISSVLCFYFARKLRLSIAISVTVIILILISPHFLARPVIFSYLLLSVWVVLILQIEDQDGWTGRRGFLLIPLMLLWANVHGSFTFGLMIFYLFLGNAIWDLYNKGNLHGLRQPLVLLVGVTIAAVVTPYGPLSALKTAQLLSDPALASIDEWRSPNFQNDPLHLLSIVGLFAVLAYFGIQMRGPRLFTLLLVTVFALEHKRGLVLFALVAPLMLVRPISACIPWVSVQDEVLDPVFQIANKRSGIIVLVCAVVVVIAHVIMWITGPRIQPPAWAAPEQAIAAARLAGVNGNVLNSYSFGGYLIFKDIPPFVDSRVELYGNQFLRRYFDSMSLHNPDEAAHILKQYNIQWALLQPGEPIAFMLKADGWVQLYADHSAIVLAKSP